MKSDYRPDSLLLRVMLFLCALSLIGGHAVAYFVKNTHETGMWIIVASLGAGLVLSLLYCGHLLLRRLHVRLADLLALFIAHGVTMAVVISSLEWLAGAPPERRVSDAPQLPNLLLLAAAALGLLLRASVLALCAAGSLPGKLSNTLVIRRRNAMILRDELRSPRLWVHALFWAAPLAWWLSFMLPLRVSFVPERSGSLFLWLALAGVLCARLALSAWVTLHALGEWLTAREAGDVHVAREARWYLCFSGLPCAGALCFYTFCFGAMRVHQDAVAGMMRCEQERQITELRKLQPPPAPESDNARELYVKAEAALPPISDWQVFSDRWHTPDAVVLLRKSAAGLEILHRAAARPRLELLADYTDLNAYNQVAPVTPRGRYLAPPGMKLQRVMVNLLMLEARHAALSGDWKRVLENTRSSLRVATHFHQQPFLIASMMACAQEETAVMALLPALLWSHGAPPPDAVLAEAQQILREYDAARGWPLARALHIHFAQSLRNSDQHYSMRGSTWPGEADIRALIKNQPWLQWTARGVELRCQQMVIADAECEGPAQNLGALKTLHASNTALLELAGNATEDCCRCHDCCLEMLCQLRLADAALAAARFRLSAGRWPLSLQECVPQFLPRIPRDPFNPGGVARFANNPPRGYTKGEWSKPRDAARFTSNAPRVYSAGFNGVYEPDTHGPNPLGLDWFYPWLWGDWEGSDRVLYLNSPDAASIEMADIENTANINILDAMNDLLSADKDTRRTALRNLEKTGSQAGIATPRLKRLLGDADPEIRMWSACVLGRIGAAAREAVPALEAGCDDPDPDVRVFARRALQRVASPK